MVCSFFSPDSSISTHAPAGGATFAPYLEEFYGDVFLLTPLREGRHAQHIRRHTDDCCISTHAPAGGATHELEADIAAAHFYSRPCGRGDGCCRASLPRSVTFLLTPLREGRLGLFARVVARGIISTHAPAGGATRLTQSENSTIPFLLTPLREGRQQFSTSPS